MRVRLKHAALLILPALAHAVSLAEWTPRAVGLPPACQAIYTAPIPGCTVKDFESGICSRVCIQSLEALERPVKRACAGRGVTGKNLIVAFLANVGPQQICPNAPHESPTPVPPPVRPPIQSGSSSQWRHGPPASVSHTWSGTSTASSLAPSDSSSLVVDTSSTPKHSPVPPKTQTSSTTSTPTSSGPTQLNTGDGSGGGSPFDTMGNLGSGAARLSLSAILAVLSGAVAAAALLVLR